MGIGIRRDFGYRVVEVAPGYPADRAGIKVGDYLPGYLDHEKEYMEFEVHRGNKVVHMKLKVERICTK